MAKNLETRVAESKAALARLNAVHDYHPEAFEIEKDGKKIIPTIVLLGQFRLLYPDGQIPCKVKHMGNGRFAAHAKVYKGNSSDQSNFLAEAFAIRKPKAHAEGIDPAGWAQTAAIGTALRNAGFGLSFALDGCIIGDEYPNMNDNSGFPSREEVTETAKQQESVCKTECAVEDNAQEESKSDSEPIPNTSSENQDNDESIDSDDSEMTIDEALRVETGIKKYSENTIGDLIEIDPAAIGWLMRKGKNERIRQAAAIVAADASIKNEAI